MSYDTFLERLMPKNNLLRIVPRKIVLTRIRINLKQTEKSFKLSYNQITAFTRDRKGIYYTAFLSFGN